MNKIFTYLKKMYNIRDVARKYTEKIIYFCNPFKYFFV